MKSAPAEDSAQDVSPPTEEAAAKKFRSKKVPLYAQGPYYRELNYKLWSTSKSRFNAAERFKKRSDMSTRAVALLSAYVVIFSLVTIMLPQLSQGSTGQAILFISSSLSILILVISQLEASQNYNVRAYTNHQSGLAISELYKELRAAKTRHEDNLNAEEFLKRVEELSLKYDDILQRSENHENIDFDVFKASKPDYEDHELTPKQVKRIRRRLFVTNFLPYHLYMIVPPVLFTAFVVWSLLPTQPATKDAEKSPALFQDKDTSTAKDLSGDVSAGN